MKVAMTKPRSNASVLWARGFGLVAIAAIGVGSVACNASEQGDEVAVDDEDELRNAEKNGKPSQQWIYTGPLPRLESITVNASLKAHTVRVTGLLPKTFTGKLPFYAEPEAAPNGRKKITVVYPIATGKLDPTTGKAPASPGKFSTIFAVAYTPTNDKAPWGGFPFMMYNNERGIAFHGPITSETDVEVGDYQWHLLRGPVSHGCNRMEGEHVVEMAHLLGIDMSKPHLVSERFTLAAQVTVSPEFDTWNNQNVDVDYPVEPGVKRPTTNVKMFKTWDSNDFPTFVCAYQKNRPLGPDHCATAGVNTRDVETGAPLWSDDGASFIGDACAKSSECDYLASGRLGTCALGTGGGVCTSACEGYCDDRAGSAPTFCATVNGVGTCLPKAHAINGACAKLPGTAAKLVDRFVGVSSAKAAKATVCAPK